jgi:hypothetical protein
MSYAEQRPSKDVAAKTGTSSLEERLRLIKDYADDLREILNQLRKMLN